MPRGRDSGDDKVLKELDTNIRGETVSAIKWCLLGESSTNRGNQMFRTSLSRDSGGARCCYLVAW